MLKNCYKRKRNSNKRTNLHTWNITKDYIAAKMCKKNTSDMRNA